MSALHDLESIKTNKNTSWQRAVELVKQCKKRDAKRNLVTIRIDKQTVVLMPRAKAKKKGLI